MRPLDNTRTWSTDTLFSAPIASSSALDGSESSDSENYLSPDAEEGSVLADEVLAEEDDNMATDAATMRRKVSRAILEAEEDVLPFSGDTKLYQPAVHHGHQPQEGPAGGPPGPGG